MQKGNTKIFLTGRRDCRREEWTGKAGKKRRRKTRELIYKYPTDMIYLLCCHNILFFLNITLTKLPLNMCILEHQLLMYTKL